MKHLHLSLIIIFNATYCFAQQNNILQKGNDSYKKKLFDQAEAHYKQALDETPDNLTAAFNLGNTLFRNKKADDAIHLFDDAFSFAKDDVQKANALYNKGVSLSQQKKLPESIDAYKSALRFNPSDSLARQNLQRALNERKKEQEKEEQNKKNNPPPKNDQKKDQNKDQSKLNQQQIKQMLQALQEQEKLLQKKVQSTKAASTTKPEKDW